MTPTTIKFITIDPHAAPILVWANPTDSVYAVAKHHVGKNHRLILIANGTKINKTATVASIGTADIYYAWRLEPAKSPARRNMRIMAEYFSRTGRPEFASGYVNFTALRGAAGRL